MQINFREVQIYDCSFFSLLLFLGLLLSLPGCSLVTTDLETGPDDPRSERVTVEEPAEPALESTLEPVA